MVKRMNRVSAVFTTALLATASAAPAVSLAAVRPTRPLTQRLLHANEIPGYTPVRPTVKLLGLDALTSVTGRTPKQLARARFLAAGENLRGRSPVPAGFVSQSSLIRFRFRRQARAFFAMVVKKHGSRTPPGVRRRAFTLTAVPGARGTRLTQSRSRGRLVEYDVLFIAGPFEYEVNVFTSTEAPSQASFIAAVTSYYHRLARSSP